MSVKVNKNIRSGIKEVDGYIAELEAELTKKETSSIHKFIKSANSVASVLADDLAFLAGGDAGGCHFIKSDGNDKILDRIMAVIKNVDAFSDLSKIADSLAIEVVEEGVIEAIAITPGANGFEDMRKRAQEKLNGSSKK